MTSYDEHGRGIIEDWHPNGHLRTYSLSRDQVSRFMRRETVVATVFQQQWERRVTGITGPATADIIVEKEWRKIPHEEEADDHKA